MDGKQIFESRQDPSLNQQQMQRLMMLPKMQQAMRLLQAPTLEMSALIEEEMEQNPLLNYEHEGAVTIDERESGADSTELQELKFDDSDFSVIQQLDETFREQFDQIGDEYTPQTAEDKRKKAYLESLVQSQQTLNEHLMSQAHDSIEDENELAMAKVLIGNLDHRGYLNTPLDEIAQLEGYDSDGLRRVLQKMQAFSPYGIAAQSLQECLLIQLRCLGQEKSLAYQIVHRFFNDLMHNRIPRIAKELHVTSEEISHIIERRISTLNLQPGADWGAVSKNNRPIYPDVTIKLEGQELVVELPEEALPFLGLNMRYLKLLRNDALAEETRDFIRQKLMSARWLMRTIKQRHQTLSRLASALAERQYAFFTQSEGQLAPLTFKDLAEQLELHESTIARAVANKYIDTPRGLYPLKFFFTTRYQTEQGEELSADTVRQLLRTIIVEEDKQKPLSDEQISQEMKRRGVDCARRTVAKYRLQYKIGNTRQRRQYL